MSKSLTHEEIYDDDSVRLFVWATLIWGIVGMSVGALAALQIAFWPANGGIPWMTFGRIRPIHTDAVIFALLEILFLRASTIRCNAYVREDCGPTY